MASIEELRKKKQEDILAQQQTQQQMQSQIAEQLKLAEQIQALENVTKQFMTKEAISRYGTLKIAHQELAIQSIAVIFQAAQAGQLQGKLTDEDYKEILKALQQGKKEFKFRK